MIKKGNYTQENVQVYVRDLIPYQFNTKRHSDTQVRQLADSMNKAYIDRIVVDEKNVIVKGHCRRMAAELLGWETIEVIKLH